MASLLEKLRKQAAQLFDHEKFKEIIDLLSDQVLEKHKDAELYAWRARAHYRLRDDANTIMLYAQKAIDADPEYWMGYHARGCAWHDKGEYDKAIADYTKALDLKPDDAAPYNNRGITWRRKGEHDKAIADYTKAIDLEPDFAVAYNNRGIAWFIKDENDKAIADYTEAIDLKPDDANAYNNRGNAWADKGEYDKAIADFNQAIMLEPDVSLYYRNRGDAYVKIDKQKALSDYQKAVDLSPVISFYKNLRDKLALELNVETNTKVEDDDRAVAEIDNAISQLLNEDKKELKKFYFNNIEDILKGLRDLSLNIDDVWKEAYGRELTAADDKWVAHYTSLRTADIFVMSENVKMRYSNAVFMNDPEEGKILIECLNDLETQNTNTEHGEIWKAFYNAQRSDPSYYYIGSFLPVAQGHEDELLMWRTYGKDENQNEAAGCCIVLDAGFFDKHKPEDDKMISVMGDKAEAVTTDKIPQPLQRVFYYNKRSNKFVGNTNLVKELKKYVKKIYQQMLVLLKKKKKGNDSIDLEYNKAIDKVLYVCLSEARFFFKSADYFYESELRMVQYSKRLNEVVQINNNNDFLPRKMYIESNKEIRGHIRKIVLGPKVQHPGRWMYLEEQLKHLKIDAKVVSSECSFQ